MYNDHIWRAWYNGSYTKMAKPIETFCDTKTGFPTKMSQKQVQEFHTDDTTLPRSGQCF